MKSKSLLMVSIAVASCLTCLSANEIGQRYVITRADTTLAISGKSIAENRSFLTYYSCEQKNGDIQSSIGSKPYVTNGIDELTCNNNSDGDTQCHMKLSWPIDVSKKAIKHHEQKICESVYPTIVSREYNFVMKKNTSEKLALGDNVVVDYEFYTK